MEPTFSIMGGLVGDGLARFLLAYDVPVNAGAHYCSILVSIADYPVVERPC